MDPESQADTERHAAELLELGEAVLELDRDWRIVRVAYAAFSALAKASEQPLDVVL